MAGEALSIGLHVSLLFGIPRSLVASYLEKLCLYLQVCVMKQFLRTNCQLACTTVQNATLHQDFQMGNSVFVQAKE